MLDRRRQISGSTGAVAVDEEVDVLAQPQIAEMGARQRGSPEEDEVRPHRRGGDGRKDVGDEVVPLDLLVTDSERRGVVLEFVVGQT